MPLVYLTKDVTLAGFPYTVGEWRVSDAEAASLAAMDAVGEKPAEEGATEPLPEGEPAEDDGPPNQSALKSVWVDYAVSQGMSREDAEAATKDELIELHG